MTKKSLQTWYYENDISYSEKELLNKIGVGNYDYHYLRDLQQILRCGDWAKNNSEIRNNLNGKIKKIIFFTPNFNDSKPDASNYSAAIVIDGNDDNWVIVYRPSYINTIESDILIKKVDSSISEIENKLNGDYPVLGLTSPKDLDFIIFGIGECVSRKILPFDTRNNPDKYILPLDIIKRKGSLGYHFAIYLGNKWVAHLTGKGEGNGTKFDTWYTFCNPDGGSSSSSFSSSFFSSSSSSSGRSSYLDITRYHPQIPFKSKEIIIRHIAKVVSYVYGRFSYDFISNNCEHLVNRCIFNKDNSRQVEEFTGPITFQLRIVESSLFSQLEIMKRQTSKIDNLTYSYSYEKARIEQCIQEAENNRSYNRYKWQIEQEKFQERIEVYPKNWCIIS